MKQKIYNLIIIDESGSMECISHQTVNGCNETLNTIRSTQEKFAETQEHFVSIFLFQGNDRRPSHYIIKNAPITEARNISAEDYRPWGSTPLYDAVGSTLVDLKAITNPLGVDATGSVTIITDGEENSSHQYTLGKICDMIDALKEMGWQFSFIGANIDVNRVSQHMHIDNAMAFQQDDKGTREMWEKERRSRMRYYGRMHTLQAEENVYAASLDEEEDAATRSMRIMERKSMAARDYFEVEEEE